jgi:hypothetical protein
VTTIEIDAHGCLLPPRFEHDDAPSIAGELCISLAPLLARELSVVHVGSTTLGLDQLATVSLRETRTAGARFLGGVGRARDTSGAVLRATLDALALSNQAVLLAGLTRLVEDECVSAAVIVEGPSVQALGDAVDQARLVALARSLSGGSRLMVSSAQAGYRAADLGSTRLALRMPHDAEAKHRIDAWLLAVVTASTASEPSETGGPGTAG